MPDPTKESILNEASEAAGEAAKDIVRGSSRVAKSALMLVGGLILTLAVSGWLNKDNISKFIEVSHDIKHLQAAHDDCHEDLEKLQTEMSALKAEVTANKAEITQLKARVAIN